MASFADHLKAMKESHEKLQTKYDALKRKYDEKIAAAQEKKAAKAKAAASADGEGASKKAKQQQQQQQDDEPAAKEKAKPKCTVCKELMAGNDHSKCKKVKAERKAKRAADKEAKLRKGEAASSSSDSSESD